MDGWTCGQMAEILDSAENEPEVPDHGGTKHRCMTNWKEEIQYFRHFLASSEILTLDMTLKLFGGISKSCWLRCLILKIRISAGWTDGRMDG